MPTLRITHTGPNVETAYEGDGPRQTETRTFSFSLSAQEAEDIRWYLEDYRVYPLDPTPKMAKRIEQRMNEVGRELFKQVLAHSDVWASAKRNLASTRIEVETKLDDALVPWELLRDPVADWPLALNVPSFVRCHSQRAMPSIPLQAGKIRILLVICRLEDDKVPFRSVARHLIRGLSDAAREPFHLEVLRPPTFEQLAKRLREAKAQGEPFHIVHFDGHGLSGEVFFENPDLKRNAQSVKAADFGKLLQETRVPLLILNACRSADTEPQEQPKPVGDVHQDIRQFGSFAHAIVDYGAAGVVAWRYSVFVDTAAQYMADLYAALASGVPLGEAATLARKQLSSAPRPTPIEDWTVPVIFEAAPVQLFPKTQAAVEIKLQPAAPTESGLPQAPDVDFIGRDETIHKLDRTFDTQSIVLLHAYAGSGKTSTAAEFARWYTQTGGLSGPVLFTSFEHHKRLPQVLDELGRTFEGVLAKSGIQWLTLDNTERRDMALQILRQVPVLWIWDNVEPVTGFPAGTLSAWSAVEQRELVDFLRAARGTKAKFLLTSRRDEREWLHELPARVELPPMPFDECVQMTNELAEKMGRRLDDVEDWRPLLRFTQGNPLTLTVLVGQALRDGLTTKQQIASFVRKLRAGEEVFEDEASEGRTRSLAASLTYGFENAFDEEERKQLALLHLFQGFVDVDALKYMASITRERGIALLDRATEVGLLTALGGGYYNIHPALPWFFRRLFEQYYSETRNDATRAFVEAMGKLGNYYHGKYEDGNRDVIGVLAAEEANLLHARSLARSNGWWNRVISTMQGLDQLYDHTGRRAEWSRLVDEIVPDFVDPTTDGPLPAKEEQWGLVNDYRVRLSGEARNWVQAERLQSIDVDWNRRRVGQILAKPRKTWNADEMNAVRSLATALHELSQIQREQGSANCVEGYREALPLFEKLQDSQAANVCAFNLGHAYKNLAAIRDLAIAEGWYKRSLELTAKEDRMGRAISLGQLGTLAYERFLDARESNHLSSAEQYYKQALDMLPTNAARERETVHNQLGLIYNKAGLIDTALHHYRESIRLCEAMQDRFAAGQTRYNAALALAQAGRFNDAHDWAQCSLRDLQAAGNADQDIAKTRRLLEQIESDLQAPPAQS